MAQHSFRGVYSPSSKFLLVITLSSLIALSLSQNVTRPGYAVVSNGNPPVKPTVASTSQPGAKERCRLYAPSRYREDLSIFLNKGAKLVEVTISIDGYPTEMLMDLLPSVYRPYHWVRSTSRQGRSLLMLDDNYAYMSMSTLSIGVESMSTQLSERPKRCLWRMKEEDVLNVFRESFLNDFKIPESGKKASLSPDEHVCSMQIIPDDGYAEFRYRCCHNDPDGNIMCNDVVRDSWVKFLLALITIIKVMVVLYSPMFLPESMYRVKYVAAQYIHHLTGPPLKLKVVVSQDPEQYGPENKDKRIRLSRLKNMEVFKTMVASGGWTQDRIYEVAVKDVRLSVKARRLLDKATVPVTMIKIIYNNLLRCRIRRLGPLQPCCETNILGKFNPGWKIIPWSRCMRIFAGFCSIVIIAIPWIIRVTTYFNHEAAVTEEKERAAKRVGLKVGFSGSFVAYLTPLHGLFIIIYLIFIVDSLVYGVISASMKEKFKYVLRQCLRDMRERSKLMVLGWITRLVLLPFQVFGVLGFLLFVPYLAILLVLTIPIIAFYIFPTLNLSLRLIIHLFIFMCPRRVTDKVSEWSEKMAIVKKHLNMHEVTADESFISKSQYTTKGIILQVIVVSMCLISFWSMTLLLMEIFSFFVELFVYTFMGIIVNAGVTMQFVTVLFLLFLYSKNTFSKVHRLYQAYHKVIHKELLAMKRDEINEVAKKEALDQENTSFNVAGTMAKSTPLEEVVPRLKIKDVSGKGDRQPQWQTSSMLVFLDRHDTPYTPEKFFFETIDLNYFGCPGPIYRNVTTAVWEFARIVMFLLFVFVVVMAFGDAYQVSTTNQLLATVVGGFVPFLFRYIFTASSGVDDIDTSSIQFKTEFHKAINNYRQSWTVYDIIPIKDGIKEWTGLPDPDETTVSSVDGNGNESGTGNNGTTLNDPNSSTTPLLETSGMSTPGEDVDLDGGNRPTSYVSIADELDDVDIIVDISTPKTRTVNTLLTTGFEKGSVTMLDSSNYSRGGSARIYKPSSNERAIDVV